MEIGPTSLPYLLKELECRTPTKIVIRTKDHFPELVYDREMWGNPVNRSEQALLRAVDRNREPSLEMPQDPEYIVTIGDVCFVIIGQIVGRPYMAVRYQPSGIVVINSPASDPAIAATIRRIWENKNPRKHVLDSLLIDFATRGANDGVSFGFASDAQVQAPVRLLYYLPRESSGLIAGRLQNFIVDGDFPEERFDFDAWEKREINNAVSAEDFLKAVAWSPEPNIRAALTDILRKTSDPRIAVAAAKKYQSEEFVRSRLSEFLTRVPKDDNGQSLVEYQLMRSLGRFGGTGAKKLFVRYLEHPSPQRRIAMIHILRETRPEWTLEFLSPMLGDSRHVDGWNRRVCDEAAITIGMNLPEFVVRLSDDFAERDRQIAELQGQDHGQPIDDTA